MMKRPFKFSKTQMRLLEEVVDLLIPKSDKVPFTCAELKLVEVTEVALQKCSFSLQFLFVFALTLIQLKSRIRHFKKFVNLQALQKQSLLESLLHSSFYPIKMLFRLVEAKMLAHYYGQKEVENVLGFQSKVPQKQTLSLRSYQSFKETFQENEFLEFDVCIVGSGAGAAPLAASLSSKGHSVIILEEGGYYNLKDFTAPVSQRIKEMWFEGGLFAALGFPPLLLPFGKTVGGTTTINSGTCFRVPSAILQKWKNEFELDALTLQLLNPYYDYIEKTIHVAPVPQHLLGNCAKKIEVGLSRMGLKGKALLRNAKDCEGSGVCTMGCPTDAKQSVQLNFIPQALQNGATLYSNCKVIELQHNQRGKISSLIAKAGQHTIKVKAKKYVVSAGTISTPLLLKKSGLSSNHVGKHLSLHPAGKAFALFEDEIRGWEGVPQGYYCDQFAEEGIMFEGIFTPPVGSPSILLNGLEHKRVMENYKHLASFGFMISDDTRGRVFLGPQDQPVVYYNLKENDLKKFIRGTQLLCQIFLHAGAKEVYTPLHHFPVLKSWEDYQKLLKLKISKKEVDLLAFHPLGTCRMGTDIENSVTNIHGQVHETENLFISDGSLFPSSLGVNPQMTIMAFSLKIADHLNLLL